MSQTAIRAKNPVNRRTKPSHHSPTPSPSSFLHHPNSPAPKRSSKQSKPIKLFDRCNSEPALRISTTGGDCDGAADHRNLTPPEALLSRPQTCTEIFTSSPDLFYRSPHKIKGYNKDSKVVVNVTVEGSPGPIKTMVKLGTSVEEAINLVLTNYTKEGRTPPLHYDDDDADRGVNVSSSSFELYSSYFSLHSISRSELIGDGGGRSFYLRRCKNFDSKEKEISIHSPPIFYPTFFSRAIHKIMSSTAKLWKLFNCLDSD